jgi:hypothetical protein
MHTDRLAHRSEVLSIAGGKLIEFLYKLADGPERHYRGQFMRYARLVYPHRTAKKVRFLAVSTCFRHFSACSFRRSR